MAADSPPSPLLVLDWDGTVVEEDILIIALERFGDQEVFDRVDPLFERGAASWVEAMELEVATLRVSLEEANAWIARHVRIRPGFHDLVDRFETTILSGNFEELIRPVLTAEGLDLEIRANGVEPHADGWRVRWNDDLPCDPCRARGDACKRNGLPELPFVYVGDSTSDHCAALVADRVFARDGLARYLEQEGAPYEPFDDFYDVIAALKGPGTDKAR
jgi:2-hydroxy-3-keto-5-methylthiopentenyl-1-phosphate phosphatase